MAKSVEEKLFQDLRNVVAGTTAQVTTTGQIFQNMHASYDRMERTLQTYRQESKRRHEAIMRMLKNLLPNSEVIEELEEGNKNSEEPFYPSLLRNSEEIEGSDYRANTISDVNQFNPEEKIGRCISSADDTFETRGLVACGSGIGIGVAVVANKFSDDTINTRSVNNSNVLTDSGASTNKTMSKPIDLVQHGVAFSPTYDQLWAPIYGPSDSYAKDEIAQEMQNHQLSFVETASIESFQSANGVRLSSLELESLNDGCNMDTPHSSDDSDHMVCSEIFNDLIFSPRENGSTGDARQISFGIINCTDLSNVLRRTQRPQIFDPGPKQISTDPFIVAADILRVILSCLSDKEEKIRLVAGDINEELRNIKAIPPEGGKYQVNMGFASISQRSGWLEKILTGLRADGEEGRQAEALIQLCEMLSIGAEESLNTFPGDSFITVLVGLLHHESNADIMLLAARALTHLRDVLPSPCASVVHYGAISCFCARLLTIISQEHPTTYLKTGVLMVVFSYLDFFSAGVQKVALSLTLIAMDFIERLPSSLQSNCILVVVNRFSKPLEQIFEIVNLANELLPQLPQGILSLLTSLLFFIGSSRKKSSTSGSEKQGESNGLPSEFSTHLWVKRQWSCPPQMSLSDWENFSSSEMNQALLKVTNISSFLTGVLAWKDPHVFIPALQSAEILMEKLSETFAKMFLRECVVHAVSQLNLVNTPKSSPGQLPSALSLTSTTNQEDLVDVDEDETDLDLAWKRLEVAKAIVEKRSDDTMEKVHISLALTEVAIEREDIEASCGDYHNALSIIARLAERGSRHIAEIVTLNAFLGALEKKLEDLQQLAWNAKSIMFEFLVITSAKAKGRESNGSPTVINSSQKATSTTNNGYFDSSAVSTTQTDDTSVGRGSLVQQFHSERDKDDLRRIQHIIFIFDPGGRIILIQDNFNLEDKVVLKGEDLSWKEHIHRRLHDGPARVNVIEEGKPRKSSPNEQWLLYITSGGKRKGEFGYRLLFVVLFLSVCYFLFLQFIISAISFQNVVR